MPTTFSMPLVGADVIAAKLAALNKAMQTQHAWAASSAGAKVIRDKARANAAENFKPGEGHLVQNIVWARQTPAVNGAYTYAIGVRAGPHRRRGKASKPIAHLRKQRAGVRYTYPNDPWYWFMWEFGFTHYKSGPYLKRPFITPAMTSERDKAKNKIIATLARRLAYIP